MTNFSIKVQPRRIDASISEVREEVDIEKLLEFDEEDIESILKHHAANQAYWEALAVRLKNRYDLFRNEWAKKWWAHHKSYAKTVLAACGENKPTMDAIKDQVILIYSEDTTETEREKYATIAYKQAEKKNALIGDEATYKEKMFQYILEAPPWYFETVQRAEAQYEENCKLVEVVAERLNSRSFHMSSLIDLLKAKKINIEPKMRDVDINNQVSERI